MRLLVLHRITHKLVRYADGIDHLAHEVTYIGTRDRLATLPATLPCTRIERPGIADTATEVFEAVANGPRPDLVIALSEYDLMAAAEVREALDVPGDRVADVVPVRDKVAMKRAVAAAGIRVPRFRPMAAVLAGGDVPWSGPTVLKPVDGAASEHVHIFDSLAAAMGTIGREGLPGGAGADGFEIEEFIEGPILHIDGMVIDSRPAVIQASRYVGTCLGYLSGKPFGSVQIDTPPALVAWTTTCLEAVGIRSGLFHLEAIESPDGVVFMEVGARFGGADTVDSFELGTGVHLPSAWLQVLTDGTVDHIAPRPASAENRYGYFIWPGHHLGGTCRIRDEEHFRTSPLVTRWVQRTPGERITTAVSFSDADVPLAGLVGGAPTPVLERFLSDLFRTVQVDPMQEEELCDV